MRQRKQKGGRGRRRQRGEMVLSHPPEIRDFAIVHNTRMRFVSTGAAQFQVTYSNLGDLIVWAKTTTTVSDVFFQVRIRRIQMWAAPTLGTATTVSCQFNGSSSQGGDMKLHSDTSMGIEPAHVSARPAAKSGASLFQACNGGGNAFLLTCPSGTVIDVELTFRGTPNFNISAANAAVGVAAGAWYFRGLDGLPKATTAYPPAIDPSQTC